MITIRPARQADLGALQSIYVAASLSNEGDAPVLLANLDALSFEGTGIDEGRTRVALEDGIDLVGFATYGLEREMMELEDLFVEPECMRRGIGRALIEDLVALGRELGATRMEVTANHHAAAFYSAMGFVEVGTVSTRFRTAARLSLDL